MAKWYFVMQKCVPHSSSRSTQNFKNLKDQAELLASDAVPVSDEAFAYWVLATEGAKWANGLGKNTVLGLIDNCCMRL